MNSDVSVRLNEAWRRHERRWKDTRLVYAVVSRRSRGISIGLNLAPDKTCNFNCVYCQVNRAIPPATRLVDTETLSEELDRILQAEKDGTLYEDAPFNALLPDERGIRDIAFSGDGEPTTCAQFEEAARIAARLRLQYDLQTAKLVLITNASRLPEVRSALTVLDENNGEIWAKLDAGTEDYFQKTNRSRLSLTRILENILDAARSRALVIQTLWFRLREQPPPEKEILAYCDRLNELLAAGGRLKSIQMYTLARNPREAAAAPLPSEELEKIASFVQTKVPIPIEVYK